MIPAFRSEDSSYPSCGRLLRRHIQVINLAAAPQQRANGLSAPDLGLTFGRRIGRHWPRRGWGCLLGPEICAPKAVGRGRGGFTGGVTHIRLRVAPRTQVMQEGRLRAACAPDQADRDPDITPKHRRHLPGVPARLRPAPSGAKPLGFNRPNSPKNRRVAYRAYSVGSDGQFVGFELATSPRSPSSGPTALLGHGDAATALCRSAT